MSVEHIAGNEVVLRKRLKVASYPELQRALERAGDFARYGALPQQRSAIPFSSMK